MAKGVKTGGRDFKPGHNYGKGRPKMTPELRKLKNADRLTQIKLEAILNEMIEMDRQELQNAIKNPRASMLHVIIGSILVKAATVADHQRLDFLLNRLIGKVREPISLEARTESSAKDMTTEELLALVEEEEEGVPCQS